MRKQRMPFPVQGCGKEVVGEMEKFIVQNDERNVLVLALGMMTCFNEDVAGKSRVSLKPFKIERYRATTRRNIQFGCLQVSEP
jgi:hypothetical protein